MTYQELFRKLKLIDKHFMSIPYLDDDLGDLEDIISKAHNLAQEALEIAKDLAKEIK